MRKIKRLSRLLSHLLALVFLAASSTALPADFVPGPYQEPAKNQQRDTIQDHPNEIIDPFTGGLTITYKDIHIPGNGGMDLTVYRTYNSLELGNDRTNVNASPRTGAGIGWIVHFGRLKPVGNGYLRSPCVAPSDASTATNPVVQHPDGTWEQIYYTPSGSPMALTKRLWRIECQVAPADGVILYSPEGIRYDMTQRVSPSALSSGYELYTTKITDRNGNYISIAYQAPLSSEITSVTTSDGRILTFSHFDSGTPNHRIANISFNGKSISYGYTIVPGKSNWQMTSATRPDGTMYQYEYHPAAPTSPTAEQKGSQHLLKKTTYPSGGVTNYLYTIVLFDKICNPQEQTSALVSKTTSDGGLWAYTYTPGTPGVNDITQERTGFREVEYEHYGANGKTAVGQVWRIGLLVRKTTWNLGVGGGIGGSIWFYPRTTKIDEQINTWSALKISNQILVRLGLFGYVYECRYYSDYTTQIPLLNSSQVSRDGATYIQTFNSYDAYGNPLVVTESGPNGGSRTTNLSYSINTSRWLIHQIASESYTGHIKNWTYDTKGNITSINENSRIHRFAYDTEGNITQIVRPGDQIYSYGGYKRGIPTVENHPMGVTIVRSVDVDGNITSSTDGEGWTTGYTFDRLNRPTSITYPRGAARTITYTPTSRTSTRGNLVETTQYDGFLRPISITAAGITRTQRFDALGRKTFVSNPGAAVGTTYLYDRLDRMTGIVHPDGTSKVISYGAGSRSVTDERGNTTTYLYRGLGSPEDLQLIKVTPPDVSATVTMTRNSVGLLTEVTQAGFSRKYGYDAQYNLTSISDPETGTTVLGRDAAGNMISRKVGTSGVTYFQYDLLNRLTSVTYPGSTPAITNTYDKNGRMRSTSNAISSRQFAYDGNGNLLSDSQTIDGAAYTLTYAYNDKDHLASMTYPRSGLVVDYAPDALGRPTAVSGFVSRVDYYPSGQIQKITYANGVVSSYAQNARLWINGFSTVNSVGGVLGGYSYAFDANGNSTSINDSVDASHNRTMSYDSLDRVVAAAGPWGNGSFTYNGGGNLLSQSWGANSIAYAYDAYNRLSSVSGYRSGALAYDVYGNVTIAPGRTFAYDDASNLRCVDCASTQKTEYSYNAKNQRAIVSKNGVKTYEIYTLGGDLIFDHSPANSNRTTEYIYLAGKRVAQRVTP